MNVCVKLCPTSLVRNFEVYSAFNLTILKLDDAVKLHIRLCRKYLKHLMFTGHK